MRRSHGWSVPLLVLLPLALGPARNLLAQDQGAAQNRGCYECHQAADEPMEFAGGTKVSIAVDRPAFLASAHGQLECVACHQGLDVMEHTAADRGTFRAYREPLNKRCAECHSAGGAAAPAGAVAAPAIDRTLHPVGATDKVPLCSDCHSPHTMLRGRDGHAAVARACATCHEAEYATYAKSVHGRGLLAGASDDLPTCTDCHPGHTESGRSLTQQRVRLGQPCMGCHGDQDLMERYGISTGVVSTYLNDFHGTSVRFYRDGGQPGDLPTLVCADCHGIHDVAKTDADNPRLMKQNLVAVCRNCHADASDSFPDAWLSHWEPSLDKAPLVFLIRVGYWIFIPFVIVGLSLQIFAHLVAFGRRKRAQGHGAAAPQAGKAHEGAAHPVLPGDEQMLVVRFSLRQRLEHFLVMVTFVILVATGLPQKFSGADWAAVVTRFAGGIDLMRTVHRVTGILFAALCVAHLATALFQVLTRRTALTIVPGRKDFVDAVDNLKYYLGHGDRPPQFDRFDYRQKFEYWGMIVGSAVMVVTGFILYFPMLFASLLPGEFIPAAKAAHTYEAMMALLTIVIWHMYGAHLNPDCYPLDKSIFSGRISVARMKHEHAIEFAREQQQLVIEQAPAAPPAPERDAPPATTGA
jgi:cytochrome b subunit of formate dehydrogenase